MTKHYWISHKKVSVDLVEDAPFALERQLDDQRFSILKNRNPQLDVPTKADKLRSQLLNMKQGATRDIAMKAKVLNKIIREESGQHTYTLVPPPVKDHIEGSAKAEIDPFTHPMFRPYAVESKQKPTIVSFGHRPSSASRVFNPATMKFRLRHGSVAKQEKPSHASGFGIPIAVLSKVLQAPHLARPGEDNVFSDDNSDSGEEHRRGTLSGTTSDPNNLFPSEDEMSSLFELGFGRSTSTSAPSLSTIPQKGRHHSTAGGGYSHSAGSSPTKAISATVKSSPSVHSIHYGESSSAVNSPNMKKSTTRSPTKSAAAAAAVDRPEWNEFCTSVHLKACGKYALRSNVMTGKDDLSISDRLTRFQNRSVAQAQQNPWCADKQINDKLVTSTGKPIRTKVPEPIFDDEGVPVDRTKPRIVRLQKAFGKDEQHRAEKHRTNAFSQIAHSIPDVNYNPLTALQLMKSPEGARRFMRAADTGSPEAYITHDVGRKHDAEREFVHALQEARRGNKRALFDYYMSKGSDDDGSSSTGTGSVVGTVTGVAGTDVAGLFSSPRPDFPAHYSPMSDDGGDSHDGAGAGADYLYAYDLSATSVVDALNDQSFGDDGDG